MLIAAPELLVLIMGCVVLCVDPFLREERRGIIHMLGMLTLVFAAIITLRDEPVMAGPPTALYRLHKFVRKNRAMVALLLIVFSFLTVGFVLAREAQEYAEEQFSEITRLSDARRLQELRQRAGDSGVLHRNSAGPVPRGPGHRCDGPAGF